MKLLSDNTFLESKNASIARVSSQSPSVNWQFKAYKCGGRALRAQQKLEGSGGQHGRTTRSTSCGGAFTTLAVKLCMIYYC